MKKITFLSAIAAFSLGLLFACGGASSEAEAAVEEAAEVVEEVVEMADSTMEAVVDSTANDSTASE